MAPTILDELKIENREKILEFLIFYSRFEYALKRTRNVKTKNGDAEANFEKFVAKNADKFNPKRTKVIEEGVNYLLEFPAKKHILENYQLKFVENPATQHGPIALRVFQCIRITRNNLFHGGKFPHNPAPEISRDEKLIQYCIIALKKFLNFDGQVSSFFWEIE